jgi:phage shock protein PspC (stress-responsive transcriptional regulator)
MKKTLDINLSGIIFHIDEDAYEALNAYLTRIRKHFTVQQGGDEVYADIESRIGELLQEKLTAVKQVVTLGDIREVIAVMGEPGQIEGEEAPRGEQPGRRARRLYRDPDQRILGGVCGGLGVYFNIDPVIFRIIFLIIVFSGFGLLLYLVLWVITPLAENVTDKLEMRGQPVTIANIEKSVGEEWTHVRGKLNDLATEAKVAYTMNRPGIGVFFEGMARATVALLKGFWAVTRVLLGIVVLLIAISFAIVVAVGVIGWAGPLFTDSSDFVLSLPVAIKVFMNSSVNPGFLRLALALFLGIPVLMLFYGGLRMAFRMEKIAYAGVTAFNIWVVSLFVLAYFAVKTANSYKVPMTTTTKDLSLSDIKGDTILLRLDTRLPDSLKSNGVSYVIRDYTFNVTEDMRIFLRPRLIIQPSPDSTTSVVSSVFARGRDPETARHFADEVHYKAVVADSGVLFGPMIMLPQGEGWHGRKVHLVLNIPVGKFVKLDRSLHRMMDQPEFFDPGDSTERVFKMTRDGLEPVTREGREAPESH